MQIIGIIVEILYTNVYGPQVMKEKRRMLQDIENIKDRTRNLHWILAGNFNVITTLTDKKGGTRRLDRYAEEFSAFIDTMELVDIRTSNGQFTWNNNWLDHHQVATRLYIFLVSKSIIL